MHQPAADPEQADKMETQQDHDVDRLQICSHFEKVTQTPSSHAAVVHPEAPENPGKVLGQTVAKVKHENPVSDLSKSQTSAYG